MVVKHDVVHHITTTSEKPIAFKVRTFNPDKERAILQTFLDLEKKGIVERRPSQWSFPVHLVKKGNRKKIDYSNPNSYRLVVDFRALNAITVTQPYAIPTIQSLQWKLAGAKIFSSIDLRSAYHAIPLDEESRLKCAVRINGGSFVWNRCPFGLKSLPGSFNLFMAQILDKIDDCLIYFDDLLIYSQDMASHLATVEKVFQRLRDNSLFINLKKSSFCVEKLNYLGFEISANGINPIESRVNDLKEFPLPSNMKELRRFIGAYSYYHKFLTNCAEVLAPLHKLVASHKSRHGKLKWTDETKLAFEKSKAALCEMITLNHPIPNADLSIQCDASGTYLGGILQQKVDNEWLPIACYSKAFSPAEQKYSTFDRELLAAVSCCKRFRYYIEGKHLTLFTDHKPLISAFTKTTDRSSPRQERHLAYISQFVDVIKHIAGAQNFLPDLLSRNVVAAFTAFNPSLSLADLARSQQDDPEILSLLNSECSLKFNYVAIDKSSNLNLLCDYSKDVLRPIIPTSFRKAVFHAVHDLSHPSAKVTSLMIRQRYVWPNCKKQIREMCQCCQNCQRSKVGRHTVTPLHPIVTENVRFSEIAIDLVGPLPPSRRSGCTHLLTARYRFTKLCFAIPLRDLTSATVIHELFYHIFSLIGLPRVLSSDRGPQFSSVEFKEFLKLIGCQHIQSSTYNPHAMGMIESFHRRLKASLMCSVLDKHEWESALPFVLLGLRTSTLHDCPFSPSEMTFGSKIRIPGEFLAPPLPQDTISRPELIHKLSGFLSNLRAPQTRLPLPSYSYVPQALATAEFVWLRVPVKNSLCPPYSGPFRVLERYDKSVKILLNGKETKVSLNRVKPAFVSNDSDSPVTDEQIPHEQSSLDADLSVNADPPDPAVSPHNDFTDLDSSPLDNQDLALPPDDDSVSTHSPVQTSARRHVRLPQRLQDYVLDLD